MHREREKRLLGISVRLLPPVRGAAARSRSGSVGGLLLDAGAAAAALLRAACCFDDPPSSIIGRGPYVQSRS